MHTIFRDYRAEAAHRLIHLPAEHKCSRLHGHSFRIRVWVTGELDPKLGWVCDFAEIDRILKPVIDALDHSYLNEIEGLENPTSENLCRWIYERARNLLPEVTYVEVRETCNSGAMYPGVKP